jgi:hypothetical protein
MRPRDYGKIADRIMGGCLFWWIVVAAMIGAVITLWLTLR